MLKKFRTRSRTVLVLESKGLYCRNGGNELSKVRSFIILGSREGLTSFNKDNSANFSKEKKYNEAQFRGGCLFFENTRKNSKLKPLYPLLDQSRTRSRSRRRM